MGRNFKRGGMERGNKGLRRKEKIVQFHVVSCLSRTRPDRGGERESAGHVILFCVCSAAAVGR